MTSGGSCALILSTTLPFCSSSLPRPLSQTITTTTLATSRNPQDSTQSLVAARHLRSNAPTHVPARLPRHAHISAAHTTAPVYACTHACARACACHTPIPLPVHVCVCLSVPVCRHRACACALSVSLPRCLPCAPWRSASSCAEPARRRPCSRCRSWVRTASRESPPVPSCCITMAHHMSVPPPPSRASWQTLPLVARTLPR